MTIIEENEKIELVYKGVQAGSGNSSDEYDDCVKAALVCFYDDFPETFLSTPQDDSQGDVFGVIEGKWKPPEKDEYGDYIGNGKKQWYYFNFGYGSCSGCDILEGSGPIETIRDLKNDIVPIPEGKSITEYIKNELNNSWSKNDIQRLLDIWENHMKERSLDDFGNWRKSNK